MEDPLKTSSSESKPENSEDRNEFFNENCECIDKLKFEYPLLYNDNDPQQYVDVVSSKLDSYIEEVEKHTNLNPDVEKPCYKKKHISSLLYVKSKKKHRRTLLAIRQVLNQSPSKRQYLVPYVLHGTFARMSISKYVSIMEETCSFTINQVRSFKKADSRFEIKNYMLSLKSHKYSLNHLKNLIEGKNIEIENEMNVIFRRSEHTPTMI
jgi:hypothetical protein